MKKLVIYMCMLFSLVGCSSNLDPTYDDDFVALETPELTVNIVEPEDIDAPQISEVPVILESEDIDVPQSSEAVILEPEDIDVPQPSKAAILEPSEAVNQSHFTNTSLDAELVKSWDNSTNTSYKYILTLNNYEDNDINDWIVDIEFNKDISLEDSWSGEYETNKNILTIYPKDYNTILYANDSIYDIGFIVNSDEDLAIINTSITKK